VTASFISIDFIIENYSIVRNGQHSRLGQANSGTPSARTAADLLFKVQDKIF